MNKKEKKTPKLWFVKECHWCHYINLNNIEMKKCHCCGHKDKQNFFKPISPQELLSRFTHQKEQLEKTLKFFEKAPEGILNEYKEICEKFEIVEKLTTEVMEKAKKFLLS